MNNRAIVTISFAMVTALILFAANIYASTPKDVADFSIQVSVDRQKNVVSFICEKGCAWETLSFGCESDGECRSSIDGYGTPAD